MRLEPKEQLVYDMVLSKGPLTPVDVAKAMGTTSMIAAAILSTLVDRGLIKASQMKYGTSKLYYASGQEARVREILKTTLSPLQIKAIDLIKQSRIILDSDLSPQLRLFLSEVPDFVKKLEVSFNNQNFVIWTYWNVSEAEIKSFFDTLFKKEEPKEEKEEVKEEKKEEPKEEKKVVKQKKIKKKVKEVEPTGYVKEALSKLNLKVVKKKVRKHDAELIAKLKNELSEEEVIIWIKPNANEIDLMKAYIKAIDKKKRVYLITNSELKNKFEEFVIVLKI